MRISDWSSDVCSSDLLGNFEQRISQMRMSLEVRMGGIEKQFTSYNKFFADNERASQLTYTELNEVKGQIAELRQQLDDTKRAINEIGRASCRERVCQSL